MPDSYNLGQEKRIFIALPVMLHKKGEIEAFLSAKERIEAKYSSPRSKVEVGAFSYMLPFTLKEENKISQIENQKSYRLPLYHVQSPILNEHALTHDSGEEARFGVKSRLEEALEHSAKLIDLSRAAPFNLVFDTHAGVFVYPHLDEEHPVPGVYSVPGFVKNRKRLFDQAAERFSKLKETGDSYGIEVVLENEPIVSVEPSRILSESGAPRIGFKPFADPEDLNTISSIHTFDSSHYAVARSVPSRFEINNLSPESLFKVFNINSWEEYRNRICVAEDYQNGLRAIHLSNTEGVGIHLTDEEEISKWGRDGTVEGELSQEELKSAVNLAASRGIPAVLEVDYNLKKIPDNKFIEADAFLDYVFKE